MSRVLVVEDDAVARRQLAQLFKFEGFAAGEAESGLAGIAAAAAEPPDLVVCNIMMPGTDGYGVLQALRARPETRVRRFILLTAKAGGADVRQGMSQGADDYITKPFDPEALLAAARQRLARRRAQMEEAEGRAAETEMRASAALPCEMEGSLSHLDTISELLAAKYAGDPQARNMQTAMREEIGRLRTLSRRLRLYGEIPSLYARRFSERETPACCAAEYAVGAAETIARQWSRSGDLLIDSTSASAPLPAESLAIVAHELVDNACKFSAPSPVVVEIRSEPAYWKLTVADRGPGMRPDQIQSIEAYKQFWNGPERPAGLGLGLVLVQALTRLNSGEFLIESEPGAGLRVTIMIPSECQ